MQCWKNALLKWLKLSMHKLKSFAERLLINLILYLKGDVLMMAMLFACRVVEGKTDFARVPTKLKEQVAEIIINDFALPEIIPEEFGGTLAA